MEGLLKDKVAIITGAGSGVGRAATLLFSRHGAKVLAVDIDIASVEAVAQEANAAGGGKVSAAKCDVTKDADVEAAVQTAVSEFGRLDIMYNNAGVATKALGHGGSSKFEDGTSEELVRMLMINTVGMTTGCRVAVRQFRKQNEAGGAKGGVIVNTASLAGLIAYGGPDYSMTKGANVTLTRSLAMQVASEGIRVNSVCPSAMPTNFSGGEWSPEVRDRIAQGFPLGKIVTAEDCANGALFLASDLSSNITGLNMPVDGGIGIGVKM